MPFWTKTRSHLRSGGVDHNTSSTASTPVETTIGAPGSLHEPGIKSSPLFEFTASLPFSLASLKRHNADPIRPPAPIISPYVERREDVHVEIIPTGSPRTTKPCCFAAVGQTRVVRPTLQR